MKMRQGFVSNSSSSSFIIMGNEQQPIAPKHKISPYEKSLTIPDDLGGETQFGWQVQKYSTFEDRLNWAALGATYKAIKREAGRYSDYYYKRLKPNKKWLNMLIKVLKKDFCLTHVDIRFNDDNMNDVGYIDHQSGPADRPENFEFFKNEDSLRQWLYASGSQILCGNDNDDVYWNIKGELKKNED